MMYRLEEICTRDSNLQDHLFYRFLHLLKNNTDYSELAKLLYELKDPDAA